MMRLPKCYLFIYLLILTSDIFLVVTFKYKCLRSVLTRHYLLDIKLITCRFLQEKKQPLQRALTLFRYWNNIRIIS